MIPPIWFLEINRVYAKLGRELQTQNETAEFESIIEAGIMSNSILEEEAVRIRKKLIALRFFLFVRF